MITPLVGLAILAMVFKVAVSDRPGSELSFLDPHAAIVVFGGVTGALCLAIDWRALLRMLSSVRDLLPSTSAFSHEMRKTQAALETLKDSWREGRRAVVLDMADKGTSVEVRVAADALMRQLQGAALVERFSEVRNRYSRLQQPTIEGWDLVGRMAPSFGMVGTVTGMVQLFRNLAADSGNMGGAMAMALLATLYGIAFGAAVGGPMATRLNNQLNERMNLIDLLEATVASLLQEDGGRSARAVAE
jgi:chemotaxis protein MotA